MAETPTKIVVHFPTREVTYLDVQTYDEDHIIPGQPTIGEPPYAASFEAMHTRVDEYPGRVRPTQKRRLHWKRVGYYYNLPDVDIPATVIDFDALEDLCRQQVESFLQSSFGLRVTLRIDLDGGPYRNLPFGYGTLVPAEVGEEKPDA